MLTVLLSLLFINYKNLNFECYLLLKKIFIFKKYFYKYKLCFIYFINHYFFLNLDCN